MKESVVVSDQSSFKQKMDVMVSSPLVKSFMAGALSGTCSTILFQPLELIKTRLQKSVNFGTRLGMLEEIANVIRQESIMGLWNGLRPSLIRCVPGIGLYFASLHWLKSTFGHDKPHPLESVVIGVSARAIAGMMVLPFTVMKTRYESGDFHYKSLSHGIRTVYTKEGFSALYSGLTPTLLRDVPFSGLYLMFYTQLKSLSADEPVRSMTYINFTSGVMAGALASVVTQPADVVKTNMQLYPEKYRRLKVAIMHIYNELGVVGFWRGMVPRMLRRTLMSAMAWTVYEEIMRAYNIKT